MARNQITEIADSFVPAGITVTLDETGEFPALAIVFPAGEELPSDFIAECHQIAGDHGASIHFITV